MHTQRPNPMTPGSQRKTIRKRVRIARSCVRFNELVNNCSAYLEEPPPVEIAVVSSIYGGRGSAMGISSELRDHLLSQPPSFKKKKDYVLEELLGRGGFGKVVRATWTPPGGQSREVALKYETLPSPLSRCRSDLGCRCAGLSRRRWSKITFQR